MRRALLAFAAAAAAATGCVAVAHPPPPPADPVRVYLLRQGAHTGVILPVPGRADASWAEYAFGNWGWYGEGRNTTVYGLYALAVPNAAALGRRLAGCSPESDEVLRRRGATLQPFETERELAERLRAELDAEFGAAAIPPRLSERSGLWVVPAREAYALNYNCSHATINWLRRLGCSVPIGGLTRSVELRVPRDGGAPAPLTTSGG